MRFARLRELAESPLLVVPRNQSAIIDTVLPRIRRELMLRGDGSYRSTGVGPAIQGGSEGLDQIHMNLTRREGAAHAEALTSLIYRKGVNDDALQALMDNPLASRGTVSFGWSGQDAYATPRKGSDKARDLAALGYDYRQGLAQALSELTSGAGMKPGDTLINSPLGAGSGDYRRALAYSRYGGFGPLDDEGLQHAVLNAQGIPEAALQGMVDRRFAKARGWTVPQQVELSKPELDEIIGTLRQRLELKDDAAFNPVNNKPPSWDGLAQEGLLDGENERRRWASQVGFGDDDIIQDDDGMFRSRQEVDGRRMAAIMQMNGLGNAEDPVLNAAIAARRAAQRRRSPSQVEGYGATYNWGELEPGDLGYQLGIPEVGNDLEEIETIRLARRQSRARDAANSPQSPAGFRRTEENYYWLNGGSDSVIPGLRGIVEYPEVPF